MTFWGLLSTSIYWSYYWKYKRGRFPSSSGAFHTIPYYSMVFYNGLWHSTTFHKVLSHSVTFYNVPWHSTTFQTVLACSRLFHRVPPHSMVGPWWVLVGPCGSVGAYLCLSMCGGGWSCMSLSNLGVALCRCVHKLVCEPTLCGLAVEPWGCVAGVVIA